MTSRFHSILLLVAVGFSCASALADEPTTRPTTQPATKSANSAQSLTAEQMLSQMLKPAPTAARPLPPVSGGAAIDKTSGSGAVAPGAPTVTVLREGSFVVDRVGRLTYSKDGSQPEFTFDSDSKTMKDPPMVILANLKLMTMESAVTAANRDLRFRVTGMVTEYHGRNYLLMEKIVVVPDIAQQF